MRAARIHAGAGRDAARGPDRCKGARANAGLRDAARGPHPCARTAQMERERSNARGRRETHATPHTIERERSQKTTQGSKAGGSGERADANSEFARKYNLDDKELGTGAFSRVILATSNEGTKVAVKCMCVSRRPVA